MARTMSKKETAAWLFKRLAEARRVWAVGESCASYRLKEVTRVARIEGDIVYLENGDSMHISKLRGPDAVVVR